MSGSYYTLNSKYNQLKSILAGLPISGSGLTGDLDANNFNILNVNDIDLTTINGAAYPPPVAASDLDATLTAGNSAGANDINMNSQDILAVNNINLTTINSAAYPPPAPVDVFNNVVYFGNSTITTQYKLYYLDNTGDWVLASNSNSKTKLVAIARGTDSAVDGMWIASNTGNIPIVVADANIGDTIFISSVAGEITGQQPAGQDLSLVRQIGYKISPTEIKFYLFPMYIEPMGPNGYGIATQIGGFSSSIVDTNNYTLLSWTALSGTRTFTISVAGLFDVLMVGGGGGGGSGVGYGGEGGGGGGAGQLIVETLYLPVGTYDVNVGAGGGQGVAGSIVFAGSSGFNLQPIGSAGEVKYEALGGVCGGSSWSGGKQGYNSGGASYRSGYGGNPAVVPFGLYGFAGGSSNGSGNNGGGGGALGAGSQRTTTNPATHTAGGGGVGFSTTFTGSLTTYGVGGSAGGNSGSVPAAPSANTGSGGAGAISTASAQNGASGFFAVRFRI